MMNYPDAAPAHLSTFSLWPDALAAGEEMAAWTQPVAYPQPEVDGEGIPLDILDSVLAWGQSGRSRIEAPTSEADFSTSWTSGGTVAEGSSSHSVPLLDATAVATPTSAPATMPPIFTDNMDPYAQGIFFPQPDFPVSRTPSFTNGNSLPSSQSDGPINGVGFLGLPHQVAPSSSFIQQHGPPLPPFDIFGASVSEHLTCVPPTWSTGGGNSVGQVQSDLGPLLGLTPDTTYPATWDLTQLTGNLAAPTEALATSEVGPSTSLGKRSRQRDEAKSGGPKKRARPSERVPGGAASTKRTRRPPTTRTQQPINRTSKAAGRGAERLASTTARGVYHRSLLGLSVPQGSMGVLELEQPSWIVGREQAGTQRDTGSSATQQISLQEHGEDLHQIPGNLSESERSMLQVTQAERERGAVRTIRCKLCPEARLSSWAIFERHCDTCERRPFELNFCSWCGVYFARSDSRNRHERDQVCRNKPHNDALMQKKEKIERLFNAFNARLTYCLKNGEEIQPMFSDAMSEMFRTANTSKKVPKKKISLEGTWAAGVCWQ